MYKTILILALSISASLWAQDNYKLPLDTNVKELSTEELAKASGFCFGYNAGLELKKNKAFPAKDYLEGFVKRLLDEKYTIDEKELEAVNEKYKKAVEANTQPDQETLKFVAHYNGYKTAINVSTAKIALDPNYVFKGYEQVASETEPTLAVKRISMFLKEAEDRSHRAGLEKHREMNKEYIQKNEAFLVENGKRKEVVTLESGLQYEILKEGSGAIPKPGEKVSVHYTGTLIDGSEFDSSVKRGEPFTTFSDSGVIEGWQIILQLMKIGTKVKVFIPENLGYGPRDMGTIKPYSTLIFEMEFLKIIE